MSKDRPKATRRDERRAQTVQEIKALAMEQIAHGGPDAVSLSGIVREMAMSPAAIYRYFANRDALLADLVVDAYNNFADSLAGIARGTSSAGDHLTAVLNAVRSWALAHPNAYLLIFQTSIGSGKDFAAERTISAASRSMATTIDAIAAVCGDGTGTASATHQAAVTSPQLREELGRWAERSGLSDIPLGVLALGLSAWTRLHGIISLELGGHLAATGVDSAVLYAAEVASLRYQAEALTSAS